MAWTPNGLVTLGPWVVDLGVLMVLFGVEMLRQFFDFCVVCDGRFAL